MNIGRFLVATAICVAPAVALAQPAPPSAAAQPKSEIRAGAPVETRRTPLPPLKPLMDHPMRDTSIAVGHDGAYYMTGTTGWPDMWAVTSDIQVFRSEDLVKWTPVVTRPRDRSVVWNADREGTWQKRIPLRDGVGFRPIWAPEIHYHKSDYWITYSIPLGVGGGILRSTSGKPEGPYVSTTPEGRLVDAIDLMLFEDAGKIYLVWGSGNIREMNADLSGFVGPGRKLVPSNANRIGFEGTFIFKANGRYYISGAEFVADPGGDNGADYHAYAASSPSLFGPYGRKFLAVPHGGHNSYFKDRNGQWWSTFFGNDPRAPFRERPAVLPIEFLPDGTFRPKAAK